jgi:outer membrane lipoprotein carrier protein
MTNSKIVSWGGRLLTVALLFFASLLSAQQGVLTVHDVAQRVDRHYNQLHSLKAAFTETYEGMGRRRTESGTLLLAKPGMMRWDYSQPAGKLFLLDGKYAWFYTRGSAQVQRAPAKQLDDLRSPLRYLLGHTQLEKEMVNLHLAVNGNGTYTLVGQPKGQEQRIPKMAMTVSGEGTILAIEAEENDGSTTHFTFAGEQVNAAAPAGSFRFVPPAGVSVVDALPPL